MNIIASFWRGELTKYEILVIQSWLNAGFEFHLYTYEPVDNVPVGVIMCDARDIFTEDIVSLFKYICNFADAFRYKMIYLTGKIWTDLDVFCINRPDLSKNTIFVSERTIKEGAFKSKKPSKLVISFMKGQKGDLLFRKLALECLKLNMDWQVKACKNTGLTSDKHPGGRLLVEKYISDNDLMPYNFAFPIDWWDFKKCFKNIDSWKCSHGWDGTINVDEILLNSQLLCIHNGWIKHNKIDKNNPVENSLYDKLCKKISSLK